MTLEDLAAQAVLAHSLQSLDRSACRVKDLQLLVDCGVSFGRGEIGIYRAQQWSQFEENQQ
ncbi:MAG: hypothetical protein NTY19_42220 [Planctomycetota bacterium]|nr:hypothetical protein [Planctomycetota bacterium]